MAWGMRCKHCGWQEADHEVRPEGEVHGYGNPEKVSRGYKKSLSNCLVFEASVSGQKLSNLFDEFEKVASGDPSSMSIKDVREIVRIYRRAPINTFIPILLMDGQLYDMGS